MEQVFEFGSVSARGLFPVTSRAEMRGDGGNKQPVGSLDPGPAAPTTSAGSG